MKIWFITGEARGLGLDIAKAALLNGDRVVATARDKAKVLEALGRETDRLMAATLNVADLGEAKAGAKAALDRFGSIDVLVKNAGYGHLGFFEELSEDDVKAQMETNLMGALNVAWAVLPSMRVARSGQIFNISSLGGFQGGELSSLYCASKFGLEGFSECLAKEVAPFGISVTIVEPGPFRTDFLSEDSLRFQGTAIADYDDRRAMFRDAFKQRNGQQPGNPVKLAEALVKLSRETAPPQRFVAGSVAMDAVEAKLKSVQDNIDRWRNLSATTDYETV